MLSFIEQGYRKELLLLNKMRMSIQAITLADIVTSNGFKISQNTVNNMVRTQILSIVTLTLTEFHSLLSRTLYCPFAHYEVCFHKSQDVIQCNCVSLVAM